MGSSGIALNKTDNLITSTGTDATAAMAALTLYYVYVSNSNASPFPTQLRASTTTYTSVNGVRYLGSSGNALNWRFVGYVYTDANTTFQDTLTQRFVINYYNRRVLPMYRSETAASWTYSLPAYRQANANTANKVEFISNGEDATWIEVNVLAQAATTYGSAVVGIGIDTTTVDTLSLRITDNLSTSVLSYLREVSSYLLSEGYHAANWLEFAGASTSVTFYGTDGGDHSNNSSLLAMVMG
jgi:hypothetical protein